MCMLARTGPCPSALPAALPTLTEPLPGTGDAKRAFCSLLSLGSHLTGEAGVTAMPSGSRPGVFPFLDP